MPSPRFHAYSHQWAEMLKGVDLGRVWSCLSSPLAARVARPALAALFLLWIAASVISAFDVWRSPGQAASREAQAPEPVEEFAPPVPVTVDIDAMVSVPLFGVAPTDGEDLTGNGVTRDGRPGYRAKDGLDGIENDAEETRLPLRLVGSIRAGDAALGRAVIETAQSQAQYFVGDALPLDRRVVVAKILSDRVVLDNEGSYELLRLFDDSDGDSGIVRQEYTSDEQAEAARSAALEARNRSIRRLAEAQRRGAVPVSASLSDVINIEVAKEGDILAGYRVSAARDEARMEALGFRAGDIITSVNGQSLSDPSRGMLLYRTLRSGSNARYGILRDGVELSLSVGGSIEQ